MADCIQDTLSSRASKGILHTMWLRSFICSTKTMKYHGTTKKFQKFAKVIFDKLVFSKKLDYGIHSRGSSAINRFVTGF